MGAHVRSAGSSPTPAEGPGGQGPGARGRRRGHGRRRGTGSPRRRQRRQQHTSDRQGDPSRRPSRRTGSGRARDGVRPLRRRRRAARAEGRNLRKALAAQRRAAKAADCFRPEVPGAAAARGGALGPRAQPRGVQVPGRGLPGVSVEAPPPLSKPRRAWGAPHGVRPAGAGPRLPSGGSEPTSPPRASASPRSHRRARGNGREWLRRQAGVALPPARVTACPAPAPALGARVSSLPPFLRLSVGSFLPGPSPPAWRGSFFPRPLSPAVGSRPEAGRSFPKAAKVTLRLRPSGVCLFA